MEKIENISPRNDESSRNQSALTFKLDGLSIDEYIDKLNKEMAAINFDTIPFDKWDCIVAFGVSLIEIGLDFFVGDPAFKYSLANKNGPFVNWMKQFHKHSPNSPLDWQGDGLLGNKGEHRAMTFGHDSLPIARLLYGSKVNESDSTAVKNTKKIYNGALLARDIIGCGVAVYSIKSGQFIDCIYTKEGAYKWVISSVNQNGLPYESCNGFVAIFKYVTHLLADFCSSASLPIPGFSVLTHWPDRDVEAFALKLYRNGMNMRTLALQSVAVLFTEMVMRIYVHMRYKDSAYTEEQIAHKLNKLLLISHGITAAVNIGKVIITKNPASLNLALLVRTCYLIWKVVEEETRLTNLAIEKLEMGVMRNRLESMRTLILLDQTISSAEDCACDLENAKKTIADITNDQQEKQRKYDRDVAYYMSKLK